MLLARALVLGLTLVFLTTGSAVAQTVPGTGAVDQTFGNSGSVVHDNAQRYGANRILGMAPSTEGAFVVLYATGAKRLDRNGRPDPNFGLNGTAPGSDSAGGISALPDGRFFLAGLRHRVSSPSVIVIRRYRADGSPDPTFGTDGVAVLDGSGACGQPKVEDGLRVTALTNGSAVVQIIVGYKTGDKYLGTVPTYHLVRVSETGSRSEPFSGDSCSGPLSSMISIIAGPGGTVVVRQGPSVKAFDATGALTWRHDDPQSRLVGIQPSGHVIVAFGEWLDRFDPKGVREERWAESQGGVEAVDRVGGIINAVTGSGGIVLNRLDELGKPDLGFGLQGASVVCPYATRRLASLDALFPLDGYIGILSRSEGDYGRNLQAVTRLGSEPLVAAAPISQLLRVGDWPALVPTETSFVSRYARDLAVKASSCGGPGVSQTSIRWQGVDYEPDDVGRLPRLPAGRGQAVVTVTDVSGGRGVQEWSLVVDDRSPVVRIVRTGPRSFAFRVTDDVAGPVRHAPLRLPNRGCHTKALVFRDKASNPTKLLIRADGTRLTIARRTADAYKSEGDTPWLKCRARQR